MFSSIQEEIWSFDELDEAKQQNVLQQVREIAKQNREEFEQFVANLAYGAEMQREVYYQAIYKEAAQWEELLLREMEKHLQAAEQNRKGAIDDLVLLYWFCSKEGLSASYYDKSLSILLSALQAKSADIREAVMEAIIDLIQEMPRPLTKEETSSIQNLLQDKEFNIRVYAYANLKHVGLLPNGFVLSQADKDLAKNLGMEGLVG